MFVKRLNFLCGEFGILVWGKADKANGVRQQGFLIHLYSASRVL